MKQKPLTPTRPDKDWERELKQATYDYVWKACPKTVPLEERDMVFARVYATMYRTLALFHKDDK